MCLSSFGYGTLLHVFLSRSACLSLFYVCGCIKLTSRLWGAAAEQLELEVVGAETLALQVLQQLPESGPQCISAVQTVPFRGHLNLEVLILLHRTRLLQVNLIGDKERI